MYPAFVCGAWTAGPDGVRWSGSNHSGALVTRNAASECAGSVSDRFAFTPGLPILDSRLETSPFVGGAHYSVADITALVAIDFMKPAKLAVPPQHRNVARWHIEVSGAIQLKGVILA